MAIRSPSLRRAAVRAATNAICAGALLAAGAAQAGDTRSDGALVNVALMADHHVYEAHWARLRALSDGGHRLGGYAMAKALCWLRASRHEHDPGEPSGYMQAALVQSARWMDTLERGAPLPDDARALPGATPLREDLRARIDALSAAGAASCRPAAAPLACAEVRLLHAGLEQGRRPRGHAEPYVAVAEDLVAAAEAAATACRR